MYEASPPRSCTRAIIKVAQLSLAARCVMEKIYQFVDDIIESRRDDFCAIADDIWDHPETRFLLVQHCAPVG
jgi:hypothetical protein